MFIYALTLVKCYHFYKLNIKMFKLILHGYVNTLCLVYAGQISVAIQQRLYQLFYL